MTAYKKGPLALTQQQQAVVAEVDEDGDFDAEEEYKWTYTPQPMWSWPVHAMETVGTFSPPSNCFINQFPPTSCVTKI